MATIVVGNVVMPDVLGLTAAAAEADINAVEIYDIQYADPEYSDTYEIGEIMAQDPAAESEVDPATTTVTLTVSLGEAPEGGGSGRPQIRIGITL